MVKIRRRTRARELVLQFLYMADICSIVPDNETIESFFQWQGVADRQVKDFARMLISGYFSHSEEIKERIFPVIKNWKEERLTVIDRNILRMASYELSYEKDVPFKVTINEAVDLGKKYSTSEAGKFVNGILDEYARLYVPEKIKEKTRA